jgi:hypothetical protein
VAGPAAPPPPAPPAHDPAAVAWEQGCDWLIAREHSARDRLLDLVGRLDPYGDLAVLLPDGTVVAVAASPDGLAIVPPDRVRRLEG